MVVLSENTQTEKEAESERQTRRRRRRREETEFREKRGGMGGKKLKRGRNCKGPYREERLCFFFWRIVLQPRVFVPTSGADLCGLG